MTRHFLDVGPEALVEAAARPDLDDRMAVEILRNPHCSPEIAARVAKHPRLMGSDRIRRLVCTIRGMPTPRVNDLVATLPWLALIQLIQDPRTPPMVRRMGEKRLLIKLPKMAFGERISLARRAHRALYRPLVELGETQVIEALCANPRLTERDVVGLLNGRVVPASLCSALLRSPRWAPRRGVRLALARSRSTPLPIALSALAEFGPGELKSLIGDPAVPARVREAAAGLLKRR